MTASFYNYTGDPDMLGKSLGTAIYVAQSLQPYEVIDDLNISLIMDYSAVLDGCNYVIVDNRCYFITERQRMTGGRIAIICAIDVLETYLLEILNLDCIIKRTAADPEQNEQGWNSLLDDQYTVTECNTAEFEVALETPGGTVAGFVYDPRPYIAVIGYDTEGGTMAGKVDNFPVYQ